jgi:urea transport system ATP-binding protein
MLEVSGVNQFYGESHTLWDVALSVPAGGCTCLIGRNGVGKTTFLKVLMGLLPARSGTMKVGGEGAAGPENLLGKPAELRARLGVGYVPQGREIFPHLDVEENLRIGLVARGRKATIPERIFTLFPVLRSMLHRRGGDLSGGQQQQLAIARALCLEPKVLILDEPTEGIQPNVVHEIGDVLMRLNREEKLSLLLVEQKLPFARRVAKDFVIMKRGRTVAAGPMPALTDDLVAQHLAA